MLVHFVVVFSLVVGVNLHRDFHDHYVRPKGARDKDIVCKPQLLSIAPGPLAVVFVSNAKVGGTNITMKNANKSSASRWCSVIRCSPWIAGTSSQPSGRFLACFSLAGLGVGRYLVEMRRTDVLHFSYIGQTPRKDQKLPKSLVNRFSSWSPPLLWG